MPVRVRSAASMAAIRPLPPRLIARSSSSRASTPSRMAPPSRARAGGDSLTVASMASRAAGTSSSSAARLLVRGASSGWRIALTRGIAASDRCNASRSRGPAVPIAALATRRSRSCTGLRASRSLARSVDRNASSSTASRRLRTRSRLASGRSSQLRNRRLPITVTVWSISASSEPDRPPSAERITSRCLRVAGSTTSASAVSRKLMPRT